MCKDTLSDTRIIVKQNYIYPIVLSQLIVTELYPLRQTEIFRGCFCSRQLAFLWVDCHRECEETIQIGSIMRAGVELVLSYCFHIDAVKVLSRQLSLEFGENLSI